MLWFLNFYRKINFGALTVRSNQHKRKSKIAFFFQRASLVVRIKIIKTFRRAYFVNRLNDVSNNY